MDCRNITIKLCFVHAREGGRIQSRCRPLSTGSLWLIISTNQPKHHSDRLPIYFCKSLACYTEVVFPDHYFKSNLYRKHIPSLITIVNIIAQNLFRHSTHTWCNTNLWSYKLSMKEFYMDGSKTLLHHEAQLYTSLPMDLWTAWKSLNIEGDITIHAMCPKC